MTPTPVLSAEDRQRIERLLCEMDSLQDTYQADAAALRRLLSAVDATAQERDDMYDATIPDWRKKAHSHEVLVGVAKCNHADGDMLDGFDTEQDTEPQYRRARQADWLEIGSLRQKLTQAEAERDALRADLIAAARRESDLTQENARHKRYIATFPARPWLETDHPDVVNCMGSSPDCATKGCQLRPVLRERDALRSQVDKVTAELQSVDARLARRPALGHLNTRAEKVEYACDVAGRCDAAERQAKHLQQRVDALQAELDRFKTAIQRVVGVLDESEPRPQGGQHAGVQKYQMTISTRQEFRRIARDAALPPAPGKEK